MRNKEEYELQFNPETTSDEKLKEVFKSRTASVLWCSIKSGHLTDQHFVDTVLSVTSAIGTHPTMWDMSYGEFLKKASPLLSARYGMINIGAYQSIIDNEFWVDIYHSICWERLFRVKIKETDAEWRFKQ